MYTSAKVYPKKKLTNHKLLTTEKTDIRSSTNPFNQLNSTISEDNLMAEIKIILKTNEAGHAKLLIMEITCSQT